MVKLRHIRYRTYNRLRYSVHAKAFLESAATSLSDLTGEEVTAEDVFNRMRDERLSADQMEAIIDSTEPVDPITP